ncbi:MAG: hypothetical protein CBC35_05105 [Planctomycetes bacterium TMED75]|nr:MAG: hypothetical protein CBC35_05105 [Planctomycetes bacterium TMED75]
MCHDTFTLLVALCKIFSTTIRYDRSFNIAGTCSRSSCISDVHLNFWIIECIVLLLITLVEDHARHEFFLW